MAYAKGGDVRSASYAAGGPVLGRVRDFMKEPDPFRDDGTSREGPDGDDQDYGKSGGSGKLAKRSGDKAEKAVKPRS